MNNFLPDGYNPDAYPEMSPETAEAIRHAQDKLDACVAAVEAIKGRVYRGDQLQQMLSIQKRDNEADVEYIYLTGRSLPILKFDEYEGELRITKLYE